MNQSVKVAKTIVLEDVDESPANHTLVEQRLKASKFRSAYKPMNKRVVNLSSACAPT
jgi:hypothetical protein